MPEQKRRVSSHRHTKYGPEAEWCCRHVQLQLSNGLQHDHDFFVMVVMTIIVVEICVTKRHRAASDNYCARVGWCLFSDV